MEEVGLTEDDLRGELIKSSTPQISESIKEAARVLPVKKPGEESKNDGTTTSSDSRNIFQLSAGK